MRSLLGMWTRHGKLEQEKRSPVSSPGSVTDFFLIEPSDLSASSWKSRGAIIHSATCSRHSVTPVRLEQPVTGPRHTVQSADSVLRKC